MNAVNTDFFIMLLQLLLSLLLLFKLKGGDLAKSSAALSSA